jgi:GAF domain-containing protein
VSLVSLVDADRQFFKSQIGLTGDVAQERQTSIDYSFCQHVVATQEPLIVDDARNYPELHYDRAIPNLNVIGYLGLPLTTSEGVTLGSFCVIDDHPRQWTAEEIEIIRELVKSVMTEIELRSEIKTRTAIETELQKSNQQFRRVHHFAGTTLQHIQETLERGADAEELLMYVHELQETFNRIS